MVQLNGVKTTEASEKGSGMKERQTEGKVWMLGAAIQWNAAPKDKIAKRGRDRERKENNKQKNKGGTMLCIQNHLRPLQ